MGQSHRRRERVARGPDLTPEGAVVDARTAGEAEEVSGVADEMNVSFHCPPDTFTASGFGILSMNVAMNVAGAMAVPQEGIEVKAERHGVRVERRDGVQGIC